VRPRFKLRSRNIQFLIDGCITALAFASAYLIRFEGVPRWESCRQFLFWLPYLVVARWTANRTLGIYRFVWRYFSLDEAAAMARSISVVTLFLLGLRLLVPAGARLAQGLRLPFTIIALEYLLTLLGSLLVRGLRRALYERREKLSRVPASHPRRLLLYGAGMAGIQLGRDLKKSPDVEVVGFLDDDVQKTGTVIAGIKVLGSSEAVEKMVQQYDIQQVVISIACPGTEALSRFLRRCREIPVAVQTIPTLQEVFLRQTSLSRLHEVQIEDLLGRERIEVNGQQGIVSRAYSGKRILVTGAGGSIGSELVRQLALLDSGSVVILDKDENAVYELEQELLLRTPRPSIEALIADVRNLDRLHAIFEEFQPQIVFHAAAHKHVPLMQKSPAEAILNNVVGTRNVLDVCRVHGVERFVYLSTDKAVNPTSIMGASKRVGEMMVQSCARNGGPPAACVRFGNVLGSRGSVIPLFRMQIAEGGPVTVTHPDVVRFFMSIPEAVHLVLCAGTLGAEGQIFILDMGKPHRILDMAHEMVALAGLKPERDIAIQITGLRPGEKLFEELVEETETVCRTEVEKLMMITSQSNHFSIESLNRLIRAAEDNDDVRIYDAFASLGIRLGPRVQMAAKVRGSQVRARAATRR